MATTAPQTPPDPAARYALEMSRARQRFPLAAAAGVATMLATALLWAGATVATGYQIGFMAIGVGLAVGYVVRVTGRGIGAGFRVLGAGLALGGCALGNLLVACVFVARAGGVEVVQVLSDLDPALALELMRATASPMDLLFYAIAVWEAWSLSVAAPAGGVPAGPAAGA